MRGNPGPWKWSAAIMAALAMTLAGTGAGTGDN